MEHSEKFSQIATALSKAQGAMDSARKKSENPHLRSKYADLASVIAAMREPFAANGLAYVQGAVGGAVLRTIITHESGEWIASHYPIDVPQGAKNLAQARGSAMTYARRYSLMALVGIVAEGDDKDGECDDGSHQEYRRPEQAMQQNRQQQAQGRPQGHAAQPGVNPPQEVFPPQKDMTEQDFAELSDKIALAASYDHLLKLVAITAQYKPSPIKKRLRKVWDARRDELQAENGAGDAAIDLNTGEVREDPKNG